MIVAVRPQNLAPLVLLALAATACSKKEPPPPTRACVLTGSDGVTPVQCFEYTENRPRAAQAVGCSEFETEPGGKKTLVDGPCPTAGRGGVCTLAPVPDIPATRSVCYASEESCRKSCSRSPGHTFTSAKQ
jgi:hypothetical protein